MKLAMAQMSMSNNIEENLKKSVDMIHQAAGSDLIFFPEVQLTPFFAQYPAALLQQAIGMTKEDVITAPGDTAFGTFRNAASDNAIYVSPNMYVQQDDGCYDTSFLIDRWGKVVGDAEMVHVISVPQFYETEYYEPSKVGFQVFDTDFGRVGIVICFDRHLPESIRTCAAMGAQLIIIPTANTKAEPMDIFEAEIRAAAYQNNVFIAMCNRVGKEGNMDFAGESLVVDCFGKIVLKADDKQALLTCSIDLSLCDPARRALPFINLRRPEMYF